MLIWFEIHFQACLIWCGWLGAGQIGRYLTGSITFHRAGRAKCKKCFVIGESMCISGERRGENFILRLTLVYKHDVHTWRQFASRQKNEKPNVIITLNPGEKKRKKKSILEKTKDILKTSNLADMDSSPSSLWRHKLI